MARDLNPTPYPQLNALLQEWVESIQTVLGDNFVAACLQGSFAVGDFDRDSDVDFITVIEDESRDSPAPNAPGRNGQKPP